MTGRRPTCCAPNHRYVCIVRPPCPKAGSRPPYDGSHTLESTNRRLEEDQPARSFIVALPPKPRAKRRRGSEIRAHPPSSPPLSLHERCSRARPQLPRAHFRATGLPKNSASQQPDQPKPPSLPPHPPLRAPPPYRPASRIPLRPLALLSSQPVRRPGSSPWRQPHPCSRCRARPAAAAAVCVSALISGVVSGSTSKARHKALSRLAGAGVKRMATHDGRDVHVLAQPAVQTPIDSDA